MKMEGLYMGKCKEKIIFHIDVNSAFLSWTAADALQHGETVDIRKIAAVIGGDPLSRHGIVLAKSMLAKKYNIKTGESLFSARQKCPKLKVVAPKYDLYVRCSNAMLNILKEYTPVIQRFSIDECFLDFSNMENIYKDTMKLAYDIKDRINRELGFTVNIGIAHNKLLAKMASDFEKPDKVHTLFENEIKKKMWTLPVGDLFMVGRATEPKLHKLNINTIGELANFDINILKTVFKSHGNLIWNYANGIENSKVKPGNLTDMKSMGNSTTMAFDISDRSTAYMVLLSLCETVGMRLRNSQNLCTLVSIEIKNSDFSCYSRQRKLMHATDCTNEIVKTTYSLFDEVWKGEKLRLLGVSVSELCSNENYQISIFDNKDMEKHRALDSAIDKIRMKYGSNSVQRGMFLQSGLKPMSGGVGEDEYAEMSSRL